MNGTRPRIPDHVFSTRFADISRWDPISFHTIEWGWPDLRRVKLSEFLKPRKQKIDQEVISFSDMTLVTIHFDGSIEPREIGEGKTYVMDMYSAEPGDIVVSKIDLKNGAVASVPKDWTNVAVTNHFAVYQPDLSAILPSYFHLLIQAAFFKDYLWRNKVGAEGRKEVKLDFFERIEIPLPDLSTQQLIADVWSNSFSRVEGLQADVRAEQLDLENVLRSKTNAFSQTAKSKAFSAVYSGAKQWDVKAGRAAAFIAANPGFVRLGDFTEECTEVVRPWENPDKEWPVYGVNNKDGVFLNSHQKGKDFNAPYKRIKKDWFFHNPTRANVGSLGKVPTVPEDAITSPEYQVWRLTGGFLPEFMALLIRTDYFLSLVDFNRVGGVKQRMYYSNLAEIRLPMIPMQEQQAIADRYAALLEDIENARAELENKKQDIEQMILGTMKIEGN